MTNSTLYNSMTPNQRVELEISIAEAERGQVVPSSQVFSELAKEFGFSRVPLTNDRSGLDPD